MFSVFYSADCCDIAMARSSSSAAKPRLGRRARWALAVAKVPGQAEYGGYDHEFVGEVPEQFICNICTKVLRDPHLTGCCGQHYCESCLTHWFKKHKAKTCPHCRENNLAHLQNKALKRQVNQLKVYCTLRKGGCEWEGELSDLQTHLDSDKGCGYVELECPNKCHTIIWGCHV